MLFQICGFIGAIYFKIPQCPQLINVCVLASTAPDSSAGLSHEDFA